MGAGVRPRQRHRRLPVPHPARSSAGGVRYAVTTGGSGAIPRIDAANPLPTGAWTHVAVTQAGDLGVLYVDGSEVARNTALTLLPASLGSTAQNRIGRSQYANDPYLDGAVDGFRLHGRALGAAEVADLHATGR
ncbi:LamG domain-containing protein [Saccharothrix yanglingensis]|uniref:LamG domain-containing protein n=1 Tax=Saccharothrix yanglingensis TaxID=659496 RepID=UPI0027D265C0|nr:LamG domain-containing protein [Saccharothrix yanglingensis]